MRIRKLLFTLALAFATIAVYAQATTSSLTGTVKDNKGQSLIGATVKAVHVPSGTVYGTITQNDGRFNIANMKVGGPYKIDITYIGYVSRSYDNISLQLGEPGKLNVVLEDNSKSLNEVEIVYQKNAAISPERQGTSTYVSQQQLQTLPTITRNVNDFARLTPQAQVRSNADGTTAGLSFANQSNKYNQFSVDGANATDVFGLASSGTNGGQAGLNPIPLDAIEQVQVVLSPYDVTMSGFTGGGINAVTRSGSNETHGSVYGFNQNQSFVGKSPDTRSKYGDFHDWTVGARVGGAIIKNKLFYFINIEGERRSAPIDNQPGASATNTMDVSKIEALSDFVKKTYGYDPGAYNGINTERQSNAIFARVDWNINEKNKLTVRHAFLKGWSNVISDGTSSMSYYNNGYKFKSTNNSTVVELNSTISSKFANVARLTYNATRDSRATPGSPFPSVKISDGGATYNLGTETNSQANALSQDNFTVTDNFTIYAGKHNITIGTDNQFYNTKNTFLPGVLGSYTYNSIADFETNAIGSVNSYVTKYSNKGDGDLAIAKVHMAQFGLYAQDAFGISENLKITYGLRADLPVFFNKPDDNPYFNSSTLASSYNVATNKVPKTTILLSPRIGFNWDVTGKGTTQLRGGVGIFTGRVPLVWISNQYSQTGYASSSINYNQSAAQNAQIIFDPTHPYQPKPAAGTVPPATEIDVTAHNFKYPRTFRANLAIDQKLPYGFVGTIEGIFTKTIQDILYKDINLAPSSGTVTTEGLTRPFYGAKVDPTFGNVVLLGNTTKGYSYNLSAVLQKSFSHGWYGRASYSFGHGYSLNDGTSSQAFSNYRYAYNVNGNNNLDLEHSNYDMGSRVLAFVSKKFTYGKFSTNLSLVYTGISGQVVSWVLYGDLNGDDGSTRTANSVSVAASAGSDLLFVPSSVNSFVPSYNIGSGNSLTAQQQYDAWMKYVNASSYLKDHVGKNTERNGARLPWENHFDFKVVEEFRIAKTHTISLSLDVFNISALLNKDWGHSYYASNQEFTPLNVATNKTGQLWTDPNHPLFTFNPQYGLNKYTNKPWTYSNFNSRYNMQIGLRYSF
ncbi:TonB-dependent receptor [Chitinophaga costaii]|nr:carboxypeptidase regulatory-like domain-containing protein [Chitinophaga costaii]